MILVLWLFMAIIGMLLALGMVLSFYFTRRSQLGEVHSPDEYGLEFENIKIKTSDGLTLHGVWVPAAGSHKAVVILHGHGGSYDFDLYRAPDLQKAGFNVLLFDFRAHGRSEGKQMTFGYRERADITAAVEFLRQHGVKHIGLLGFSYGGIVAMLYAAENTDVEAVISDGGPARMRTAIAARVTEMGFANWLARAIAWLIIFMTSIRMGTSLFKYEPIRWVGHITPRPILFIHGDQDKYLPDFDELYAATRLPKEVWRLPNVGHTNASQFYPEEYTGRIIEFFKRKLRNKTLSLDEVKAPVNEANQAEKAHQ
jgi:pimeloyl-ACP methyl ester carboxylesterase